MTASPPTLLDWINTFAALAGPIISGVAVLIAIIALRNTQHAQRDLQLPILLLDEEHTDLKRTPDGTIDWIFLPPPDDVHDAHKVGLTNVGTGIAFNIQGVIFGPPDRIFEAQDQRLSLVHPMLLKPAEVQVFQADLGRTVMYATSTIGTRPRHRYTLLAPSPLPEALRFLHDKPYYRARLTITYRDIYGCKHASIYNFTNTGQWEFTDLLNNIPYDLTDLNQRDRIKRIPLPVGAARTSLLASILQRAFRH